MLRSIPWSYHHIYRKHENFKMRLYFQGVLAFLSWKNTNHSSTDDLGGWVNVFLESKHVLYCPNTGQLHWAGPLHSDDRLVTLI